MRDGGGSTFFKDLLFRRMRFVRTHKNLTPIARNCQKRYCENWFLTASKMTLFIQYFRRIFEKHFSFITDEWSGMRDIFSIQLSRKFRPINVTF
jgi:hypothetical protein